MAGRTFAITGQQWERFVECITPTLGELLAASLLDEAADEVVFLGGRSSDDLRCRIDKVGFTVEVKSAWWHDNERSVIGHSPVRGSQRPDLVALFGRFDVRGSSGTVHRIAEDCLTIEDDRFFYLVPLAVIDHHSRIDGKSTARALISTEVVQPFAVDLAEGLSRATLGSLLRHSDRRAYVGHNSSACGPSG